MSKPINQKCSECPFKVKRINSRNKPECYEPKTCQRKRNYYRYLKKNRKIQRTYHRYLKFKGDKCALCKSKDNLQVHHIKEQLKGGDDKKSNLMTLCYPCHIVVTKYSRALHQLEE